MAGRSFGTRVGAESQAETLIDVLVTKNEHLIELLAGEAGRAPGSLHRLVWYPSLFTQYLLGQADLLWGKLTFALRPGVETGD